MNNEFKNNNTSKNEEALPKENTGKEPFVESEGILEIVIDEEDLKNVAETTSVAEEPSSAVTSAYEEGSVGGSISGSVAATPEFTVTHKITQKEKSKWPRLVAMALAAGALFGAAFGIVSGIATKYTLSKINIPSTQQITLSKDSDSGVAGTGNVAMIVEECMPSVVAITNRGVADVMTFFGEYKQESFSSGSGIIIGKNDTELLIITNYHVVANSTELSVIFSSVESKLELQAQGGYSAESVANEEYIPTAVVKGYDSDKDLAVIAVELGDIKEEVLDEIKIATIGDSSKLKPGDQVIAIGNALGYGQSVTTGIISAVNRKITMESVDGKREVTNAFIQTDAAINSGNSGGALLDMEGRLIGINSVKIATTGVEGMGYSIPISDVENIIDELVLRKTRKTVEQSEQGFLGITGADVSAEGTQVYGIPAGVFVESVMEGLAAEKAGIKKGYVITEFDGITITSMSQLQESLKHYKAGEKVKVKVQIPGTNGYTEKELTVKLSSRPEDME